MLDCSLKVPLRLRLVSLFIGGKSLAHFLASFVSAVWGNLIKMRICLGCDLACLFLYLKVEIRFGLLLGLSNEKSGAW